MVTARRCVGATDTGDFGRRVILYSGHSSAFGNSTLLVGCFHIGKRRARRRDPILLLSTSYHSSATSRASFLTQWRTRIKNRYGANAWQMSRMRRRSDNMSPWRHKRVSYYPPGISRSRIALMDWHWIVSVSHLFQLLTSRTYLSSQKGDVRLWLRWQHTNRLYADKLYK